MLTDMKCLFVVMMDIDEDKEADFNRVYDEEHIPILLQVPGVIDAARFKTSTEGLPSTWRSMKSKNPDVPESDAFREASDIGEWAPQGPPLHQEPLPHHLRADLNADCSFGPD